MAKFLLIDHHDNPRDDLATTVLRENGFDIDLVCPFKGDKLPEPGDQWVGALIYGGAMNVTEKEEHLYLNDELHWIEQALEAELPLLGICLGAQLIAHALGAKVDYHPEGLCEFGFYEIHPVLENTRQHDAWFTDPMHVTQAHYQHYELPAGCHRMAYNEQFSNQAFRYGDLTYGLQFHPEVTEPIFRRWQDSDWAFFDKPGAQTREEQDAMVPHASPRQETWFRNFLGNHFPAPNQRAA